MMAQGPSGLEPNTTHVASHASPGTDAPRQERLNTLYAKWDQFAAEFEPARQRNDQELMTNLRGLMLLIKKEIIKLGGEAPEFPYSREHHVADL